MRLLATILLISIFQQVGYPIFQLLPLPAYAQTQEVKKPQPAVGEIDANTVTELAVPTRGTLDPQPEEETPFSLLRDANRTINRMLRLADLDKKLKLNPRDQEEMKRWLEAAECQGELLDTIPLILETAAAQTSTDSVTDPDACIAQKGITDLATLHHPLFQTILLLLNDKETADPGFEETAGEHEYMEISRIMGDYEHGQASTEETKNKLLEKERFISSHAHNSVQAADVSALDYIRCTKLTVKIDPNKSKTGGEITKREKQPAIPIEFVWQTDAKENQKGLLSPDGTGIGSDPGNILGSIIGGGGVKITGTSFDDLLRGLVLGNQGSLAQQLMQILAGRTPIQDVVINDPWGGNGEIGKKDLSGLLTDLGEAVLKNNLGGLDPNFLQFGTTLPDTVRRTGSTILAESLPSIPPWAIQGKNAEELAQNVARYTLGQRIGGSQVKLEGDTTREALINLGLQYATKEIFGLEPTTFLRQLPMGNTTEVQRALGSLVIFQKLGVRTEDITGQALKDALNIDPGEADILLGLPNGTSSQVASGTLSANQFAEQIGKARIETTIGAYAADGTVRTQAYNLAITFGPEDFFIPSNTAIYPTFDSERDQILALYGRFMTDTDKEDFRTRYKAFGRADALTDDASIRLYLAEHMTVFSDIVSPILDHPTDDTWLKIGQMLVAKLLIQPNDQLGVFTFLQNGQSLTLPMAGTTQQTPITDLAKIDEALGLLPGDFQNFILKDSLAVITTRLGHDLLAEATGNTPKDNAFLGGLTRRPFRDDTFLTSGLTQLAKDLQAIGVPKTDQAVLDQLKQAIADATPAHWQPTNVSQNRDDLIDADLSRIASLTEKIVRFGNDTERLALRTDLAQLVAGRSIATLGDLSIADTAEIRAAGLTSGTLTNIFTDKISPDAAREQIGSQYISRFFLGAADDEMAADLLTVVQNPQKETAGFITKYQSELEERASITSSSLNTSKLDTSQFFNLFAGNKVPILGQFDQILHESLTGIPGKILGTDGSQVSQLMGVDRLMQAAGLTGSITLDDQFATRLPRELFRQMTGIIIPPSNDPTEFLKTNGDFLLRALDAPQTILDQFSTVFDANNPQRALDFLKNGDIWKQIDPTKALSGIFSGNVGGPLGSIVQGIFTGSSKPNDLLGPITNNLGQFFPNLPIDPKQLFDAIKKGDNGAITGQLSQLGSQFLGPQFGGILSLLTNKNLTGKDLVNTALGQLPQFFGQSGGPVAALAGQLGSFFLNGQKDTGALLSAVSGFGQSLGIPFIGDALKIATDPKNFGLSFASGQIAGQLSSVLGINVPYDTVRNVLFGPDAATLQAKAGEIRSRLEGEFLTSFGGLSPEAQQQLINDTVQQELGDLRAQSLQGLQFQVLDGLMKGPAGFTQAMLSGTGEQQLNALVSFASGQLGLPKEVSAALEIFKNGGDLSQISDQVFGQLDGVFSSLTGNVLPAGFGKQIGQLVAGNLSIADFQNNLGNFGIGTVSGALDKALGLPGGTAQFIQQGLSQLTTATNAVNSIQNQILQNPGQIDAFAGDLTKAQANLANIQGALAGTVVNMVFGKQLSQLESSLGLPSGTASFLVSSGITSIFGGGAFTAVLSSALPMFAAAAVLGSILGGGLLGGGTQEINVTYCSAGGFYPFIKKDDEESEEGKSLAERTQPTKEEADNATDLVSDRFFDPNLANASEEESKKIEFQNLEKGDLTPKNRMTPKQVQDALKLWLGYPGEFFGQESSSQEQTSCEVSDPEGTQEDRKMDSYDCGKKKAARWKIRNLTGNLLLQFSTTFQTIHSHDLYLSQIVVADIPVDDQQKNEDNPACGNDWDYLSFYMGDFDRPVRQDDGTYTTEFRELCKEDDRFVQNDPLQRTDIGVGIGIGPFTTVADRPPVGILDWTKDFGGYGTFENGSMVDLHNLRIGGLNLGMWADPSDEFRHHVHFGF